MSDDTVERLIGLAEFFRDESVQSAKDGDYMYTLLSAASSAMNSSLATALLLQEQSQSRVTIVPTPPNLKSGILNCDARNTTQEETN